MQRFVRIEALLGEPINGHLRHEHLQRLVDEGVAEDEDLDFKREMWPATPDGRAELAKDVAALANRRGGLLVVGIATASDKASKLMPWPVGDADLRHLRSVVAAQVHPLPDLETLVVPGDEDGLGFLLVVIPRSPQAPHAISRPGDADLRYWVRDGSRTRWLAESEVADAYLRRHLAVAGRGSRLSEILAEGIQELDRRNSAFLALALTPHLPGAMPINAEQVARMGRWFTTQQRARIGARVLYEVTAVSTAIGRFTTGRYDTSDTSPLAGAYFEMHQDGSSFGAVPLYSQQEPGTPWRVHDEDLVDGSAGLLRLAVAHMVENGACWGDADVEVRLLEPRQGNEPPSHSMVLWGTRVVTGLAFPEKVGGTRPIFCAPSRRHTVAATAISTDAREWMMTTRLLSSDLVQAFGLPEPVQITGDGGLRLSAFSGIDRQALKAWADEHQIQTA